MSDLIAFATARRTARASLFGTWCDGGTITFYTAPRPADADSAVGTATALAVATLADPAGAAEAGVWTADPLPDAALITASGFVAWARVRAADDATVGDFSVGVAGSGAAVIVDTQDFVAGAVVRMLAFAVTEG